MDNFTQIAIDSNWNIDPVQAGGIAAIAMEGILVIMVGLLVFFHLGNTSYESKKIGFRTDKINDLEVETKRMKGDYEALKTEDS